MIRKLNVGELVEPPISRYVAKRGKSKNPFTRQIRTAKNKIYYTLITAKKVRL